MADEFDVFLSHKSQDKPAVEKIGEWLKERGLRVWLDKWELRPGFPWQEGLEEAVRSSRAVAVFVGEGGLGAWQAPEMRAFIERSRREQVPVIPVLLPGCPESPQLSIFLDAFTWVDLRGGVTEEGLGRLAWGITGNKPAAGGKEAVLPEAVFVPPAKQPASAAKIRWRQVSWLSLLGVVLTLAAWLWPRSATPPSPAKPQLYAVRVQVLDPRGSPVEGAKVQTSAGNEPHLLPDGWWEIQVPAVKVPADGHLAVWAKHPEWEDGRTDLTLGADPNPRAEVRLKTPETWLRGRVFDADERALTGARITPEDGTPGEAISTADGRFELRLPVPPETRVALRAEHPQWAPARNVFCFAGRDSCSITLEKR